MAYLGDAAAASYLIDALDDDHWRVRMTAIQTLGRLGIEGITPELTWTTSMTGLGQQG